jgi:hypothetical protein
MNGKLILQLSLFGLAMAFGTVYVIPSTIEPMFWLLIFLLCAFLIATKAPGNYFLHGLVLGLANSVWVTGVHLVLVTPYLANHPTEAEMMASAPFPVTPMMLITGPIVGLISGAVIGLLAVVASKIVRRR